jgi:glycerol-3-phosphate cytidylyltransferase
LGFDIVFKWSDAEWSEKWTRLEEEFRKINVQIIFFPYTKTVSTTLLIKKLWEY